MADEQCWGRVWDRGNQKFYQCQKAAKYEINGRHYCGTHNPEAAKRRTQKANERYRREMDALVTAANQRKQNALDASRYRWLRDRLYAQTVIIGEARVDLQVVGACPSVEEFDAAIDNQMAEDARYTITDAGRAMLKDGK